MLERITTRRQAALITLCAAALLSSACSTQPPSPPPPPPVVGRIGVLPVLQPDKLYTENFSPLAGVLYPSWVASLDNHDKSKRFTVQMEQTRAALGTKFTALLLQELQSQGFEAELLAGVPRKPDDPESVEYTGIPYDGHVLHAYFRQVGMYSGFTSANYVPRVNVTVYLVDPRTEDYPYSETLYYGADAGKADEWSIPAKATRQYASFEALTLDPKSIDADYEEALGAVARHVATQFRQKFK